MATKSAKKKQDATATPAKIAAVKAMIDGSDALTQALGSVPNNDVFDIPSDIQAGCLTFLEAYLGGAKYADAMQLAGLQAWQLSRGRIASKTFAATMDAIRQSRSLDATFRIEDELRALALGEVEEREGYLRPSEKAAALLLSAWDGRYKPGASVPCTAINIQVNGLPM